MCGSVCVGFLIYLFISTLLQLVPAVKERK